MTDLPMVVIRAPNGCIVLPFGVPIRQGNNGVSHRLHDSTGWTMASFSPNGLEDVFFDTFEQGAGRSKRPFSKAAASEEARKAYASVR